MKNIILKINELQDSIQELEKRLKKNINLLQSQINELKNKNSNQ